MDQIDRVWNCHVGSRGRVIATAIALAAMVACWGCGNDGSTDPIDPGPDTTPRSTPQELMHYFEDVYAGQDSALYAAMLHDEFTFEFIPLDADSLRDVLDLAGNAWGRTSDLVSTGNLFRSEEVIGITLSISVNADNVYMGEDCDDCRQLGTTITLRVSTVGDGTEPLIYSVFSPQMFFVRPDPSDSTKWVIWRQVDQPGSFAKSARTLSAGHV